MQDAYLREVLREKGITDVAGFAPINPEIYLWKGYDACERYENLIERYKNQRVLYLELGVGENIPVIVKYPSWRRTNQNPLATYVCINYGEAFCPKQPLIRVFRKTS